MPRKNRASAPWPQLEVTTLADQVYHIIRDRILHRELVPGTFIREQDVCQGIGVSRTPVREALNRLASQDFLERVPHRGFRIPDSSWETLLEVYPIVGALEVLAGTLAFAHLTPADLGRLRELSRRMAESGTRGDAKRVADLAHSFHRVFSERSGNYKLAELLDQLRAQVTLLDGWYFSVPEHAFRTAREHEELFAALEDGDFPRALQVLERDGLRRRQTLEEELSRKGTLAAIA